MEIVGVFLALAAGSLLGWLAARSWYAVRLAPAAAERDLLRERVVDLGWGHRLVLDLVVPRAPGPGVVASLRTLRAELGLAPSA